jgi:hypothetical protein
MSNLVTTVLSIKSCGHDEIWLRDRIHDSPNILGLGDLQAVMKEKPQSQGGRLDLLLTDPTDNSMFEVEIQLGETDPSHIIRTIEYWDKERRRWPNRNHTAVLVAEKITSRFFNVVQLLSKAVPIIGIQANMLAVGETRALHFTTIIDSSDEPGEGEVLTDENYWRTNYAGAYECACWYRDLLVRFCKASANFRKTVITLYVGGTVRAAVFPKKGDRALLSIEKLTEANIAEAEAHFHGKDVAFTRKGDKLIFDVNLQQLKEKAEVHEWIAQRLAAEKGS